MIIDKTDEMLTKETLRIERGNHNGQDVHVSKIILKRLEEAGVVLDIRSNIDGKSVKIKDIDEHTYMSNNAFKLVVKYGGHILVQKHDFIGAKTVVIVTAPTNIGMLLADGFEVEK